MWFRFVSVGALVAGLISLYGIVHKQGETIGNQGGTIHCLRGVIVQQQAEITARDEQVARNETQIDGLAAQLQAHGIQPLYVGGPPTGQPPATSPPVTATTPTTQGRRGSTTTTTHPPTTTTTTTSPVPVITLPTVPVVAASVSQQSC